MTAIRLVRDYAHGPDRVWRALTEPTLMAQWMVAARPVGFSPTVGTRFRFEGKPTIGWSGVVHSEVLEATPPRRLRYSWVADDGERMILTYEMAPHDGGTRLHFEQAGFKGVGGLFLAKVIMTPVRKKMFGPNLTNVLRGMAAEASA